MLLINTERHVKVLATYYLYFNCSKYQKKAREQKTNKKSHVKHGITRVQKVRLADEVLVARGTRCEHMRAHEST